MLDIKNKNSSVQSSLSLSLISFLLVLALIFSTPLFLMDTILPQGYKIFRIYAYGALFILQIASLIKRGWNKSFRIFASPSIAVLIWFLISITWADHFDLSIRRVFLTSLIYFSIFSGVMDLGYRRTIDVTRFFLVVVLVVNIVTVFVFPEVGVQKWLSYSLWRGLLADKNIAGVASAVTLLMFMMDGRRILPHIRILIISLSALFLYESWSRTAMISATISLSLGFFISRYSSYILPKTPDNKKFLTSCICGFFAILILSIVYLTVQRETLLSFTDDASGLSLRNSIWRPMIQYYLDHPFLGSGYGSYWDASVKIESDAAFSTQKWLRNVDQGHSGYLDLLVQTGFFGLALALWAAMAWPMTQFVAMVERQPDRAALTFSLLIFFLIENITESSLFADDALGNLFIIFSLAQVHRFKIRSSDQVGRRRDRAFDTNEPIGGLASQKSSRVRTR